MSGYAELQATSNFSFLRGGSHPGELVTTAKALGQTAIGVADRNTLAGVVRAWSKGREIGQKVLTGSRLDFADGSPSVLCYPTDREAYGRLSRLLTLGQRRSIKGQCHLTLTDLANHGEGQLLIAIPPSAPDEAFERQLAALAGDFRGRVWLAASRGYGALDLKRLSRLAGIAATARAPLVATNDVLYHTPARRPLQDVLSCLREGCAIQTAGLVLEANAERHLKAPAEMLRLFHGYPGAVARTLEISGLIDFNLSQLKYEYPDEPVPPGKTAMGHLTDLTWAGAAWRYPSGLPQKVRALLIQELGLIDELDYPNYFLTVHDIVHWARSKGILCQGRGSAANSAVCFCLGVTSVDPMENDLLFARFISKERSEPPDIDVDFEHERREQVMQYVFERYGRERAAICATVIHYRPRSAIRDVGKALGLTEDITAALAGTVWGSWGDGLPEEHIRQVGLDPNNLEIRRATALATELMGFPRHLSQHVGGFILTKRRLDETVPIGNAAMDDRTFIEWDKDDIDDLGLMKVDVLALGMLTALKRGFDMLAAHHNRHFADIADVPAEDPAVYEMLCHADSVGVFQVESRAQMSMLPRLKPREFYDLVIEVAIIRPGPIQGGMVHPYLSRRQDPASVRYPSAELEQVLQRTLGVPIFQEQVMQIAVVAAGFSAGEADQLRRSMAAWKRKGGLEPFRERLLTGMQTKGYQPEFAESIYRQILGFGEYGFPESHAASFALLTYVSCWLKCHEPAAFIAALLNSQPMGFYQPAQLVQEARRSGVAILPPDVLRSDWDYTLERGADGALAIRIGLRQVRSLARAEAQRIVAARAQRLPRSITELAGDAALNRSTLQKLAAAGALHALSAHRHEAAWLALGAERPAGPLRLEAAVEAPISLPVPSAAQEILADYRQLALSTTRHPLGLLRERLRRHNIQSTLELRALADGARVRAAGLITHLQQPGTASGVVFLSLEDETGIQSVILWPQVFETQRRVALSASLLVVSGTLQNREGVTHLIAQRLHDRSAWLGGIARRSRDFH